MTVKCPRCGTLYRRPASPGVEADATFRCARCRHVFAIEAEEPLLAADEPEADLDADDERFVFDDTPDDEPPAAPAPPSRPRPARAEHATPAVSASRLAVRLLLLVTLFYGVLSVYLYTHPARARQVLRQVPLVGTWLAEPGLDPAAVELAKVSGEYRRVRGDHLVFVVAGTAVNNSPVPVRGIQVAATLGGADARRQVVFCGAAPREVENLSLREIELLQTIEPPREWALAPGEETTFLVVFADPPADLREFAAEVVAVRAPRRAA